jgi:hypothetical protein
VKKWGLPQAAIPKSLFLSDAIGCGWLSQAFFHTFLYQAQAE